MATDTQIENLRVAYSVMAGVPSEIISLQDVRASSLYGPEPGITDEELLHKDCGSVACTAGLLSAHPHFKAQGLSYHKERAFEGWEGNTGIRMHGEDIGLYSASEALFGVGSIFNGGPHGKAGKMVALERIRVALWCHGAITGGRVRELVKYERTLS